MSNELPKAVLDTSILIQTLVREEYTDTALKLVSTLKEIFVPSLLLYEIGNVLVMLARKNLIIKEDAIRKFKLVSSIPTLSIKEVVLSKAIDIAIELQVTLYDATYLTLALEEGTPLITVDRDLYEKGRTVTKVVHASEVTL